MDGNTVRITSESSSPVRDRDGLFASLNQLARESIGRSLELLSPRNLVKSFLDWLQLAAGLAAQLTPQGNTQLAWRELQNKVEAFTLFEQLGPTFDGGPWSETSLAGLVASASRLETYVSVWTLEGLGHYFADLHLAQRGAPVSLLNRDFNPDLPDFSMVPLHAGLGLSLAEWVLPSVEQGNLGAIEKFIKLCRTNSRREYLGAALEGLGLAARTLYPHCVKAIDARLAEIYPEAVGYFWHGVGRGIYFSPMNFFLFRNVPWHGLQMCRDEPPHHSGRWNAIAGFSWALALINIRNPEIIAEFLNLHGGQIAEMDAGINGISSALMIWQHSTSNDRYLRDLIQYQPAASVAPGWNEYMGRSCEIVRRCSAGEERMWPGELFRFKA